jgi:hypothetical protein
MVTMQQIEDVSRVIARQFHPQRILLFGLYAWGAPSPNSDVDLPVITPFEGKPAAKLVEMRLKVKPDYEDLEIPNRLTASRSPPDQREVEQQRLVVVQDRAQPLAVGDRRAGGVSQVHVERLVRLDGRVPVDHHRHGL